MVLAKELVDKLKKIEDFDITYESSDKDSGEIRQVLSLRTVDSI